jgi:signal peptidase I
MSRSKKSVIRETVEAIIIALILALFIRTFVVQAFKIPSSSMEPTLLIGDHLLVNKFAYGISIPFSDKKIFKFDKPQRGDIIVFEFPEDRSKDFIKRVLAVEGDTIEIKDKKVFINGKPFDDPYGVHKEEMILPRMGDCRSYEGNMDNCRDNFGPIRIPKDAVFVMGDNRDRSYDSRYWGFVDLSIIEGKAWRIYWSWNGEHRKVRWSRLGSIIQ